MALHWTLDSPKSPDEVREKLTHYLKIDQAFLEGVMTEDGFNLKTRFEQRTPTVCLLGRIRSAQHGSLVEVIFTKTEVDALVMSIAYPGFIVGLSWASWPVIQRGEVFLIPIFLGMLLLIHLLAYSWPASRQRRRAKLQLMSLLAPKTDDQIQGKA